MNAMLIKTTALAALAALLVVSGGCANRKATPEQKQDEAFADVKADVRAAVSDPGRADQAISLISELEDNFDKSRIEIQTRKDNIRSVNRDYDSTRADFEREFAALEQEIENINSYFLRITSEVRGVLTEDELEQINKSRNKYIEAAVRSLRAI